MVGVIVSTVPTSMYCTVCTVAVGSFGIDCESCTNGRDEPTLSVACRLFCAMALQHSVPTISPERLYAAAGALASYGASLPDSFRQVGAYVGRILKGEKPAALPVLRPVKFELV